MRPLLNCDALLLADLAAKEELNPQNKSSAQLRPGSKLSIQTELHLLSQLLLNGRSFNLLNSREFACTDTILG